MKEENGLYAAIGRGTKNIDTEELFEVVTSGTSIRPEALEIDLEMPDASTYIEAMELIKRDIVHGILYAELSRYSEVGAELKLRMGI